MNMMISNENFSSVIPGLLSKEEYLAERHAERTAVKVICTDSFVHALKMLGFLPYIEVKDDQGDLVKILPSSVKAMTKKFLITKKSQDLNALAYRVTEELGKEFSKWLRLTWKSKNAKYCFIGDDIEQINWLNNVCWLALIEYVSSNKREQGAFIDDRAATLADIGMLLRRARGYMGEGVNHNTKNNYDADEREEYIDSICKKLATTVEDLASRDLPGYALPALPPGTPDPLPLPRAIKRGARGQ